MATNKHATIRFQALDKCFRNSGKRYYMEDLIEACNYAIYEYTGSETGIKRRQIFEDIKFMESPQGWNVPLEHYRDGHKVYYRYSDLSFSINNQPLNATEQSQLKEALLTLSRFKGMPQFEWVDELSARLDSSLGLNSNTSKVIEFDENTYLKGKEYLAVLYTAIINKQVLNIAYKSFKSTKDEIMELHPYYLKQYNSRWFLFGYNEGYDSISNLALDRVISFTTIHKKYHENKTVNFEEYFEDVVGVTVSNRTEVNKVLLEIDASLWPYIESKPIHGSQRIISKKSGKVIIELAVQINYELVTTLLAFGEGVKVMQPDSLKEEMVTKAKAIIKKYL